MDCISITVLRTPQNTAAKNCPAVMKTLLSVTRVPRLEAGHASAMYTGTDMLARPEKDEPVENDL